MASNPLTTKHLRLPIPLARALETAAKVASTSETVIVINALEQHPAVKLALTAQKQAPITGQDEADLVSVTISSRTHNLGFGWSNKQVKTASGMEVFAPNEPDVTGGIHIILDEYNRARRRNSNNIWAWSFFVGYQQVTAIEGYDLYSDLEQIMEALRKGQTLTCKIVKKVSSTG